MAHRTRRPKPGPKPYQYYFRILAWYVRCDNTYDWKVIEHREEENAGPIGQSEIRETEVEHRHSVDAEVELLNPVKKVAGGRISIVTSRKVETLTDLYPRNIRYEVRPQDDGGGCLWSQWDDNRVNRVTTGLIHVDECCFLAIVQVLTSCRSVILDLNGDEFYRNRARIRSAGWFTEGDPDLMEDLEYSIEESKRRRGR